MYSPLISRASTLPVIFPAGQPNGWSDTFAVLQHLFSNPVSLAVMLWVGLGPGALAAYLQATGQQSVPPAQAQVIYATTPIFATGRDRGLCEGTAARVHVWMVQGISPAGRSGATGGGLLLGCMCWVDQCWVRAVWMVQGFLGGQGWGGASIEPQTQTDTLLFQVLRC